jgi:hypothetical protein
MRAPQFLEISGTGMIPNGSGSPPASANYVGRKTAAVLGHFIITAP